MHEMLTASTARIDSDPRDAGSLIFESRMVHELAAKLAAMNESGPEPSWPGGTKGIDGAWLIMRSISSAIALRSAAWAALADAGPGWPTPVRVADAGPGWPTPRVRHQTAPRPIASG